MTIRVYLDTQDYYRLYKNRTKEQQEIYDFLIHNCATKKIEIGFSYCIVSEFLQDFNQQHKEDRLERARFIKTLCGKNCFKFITRLNTELAFSREGDWTPVIQPILNLDLLNKAFMKEIEITLPTITRNQRNALKNKRTFKRYVQENRNFFEENMDARKLGIPVSKKFSDENMLVKYILGEILQSEAEREFLEIITDLELFIMAWFEYGQKRNFLFENIRQPGEKIKDAIEILCKLIFSKKQLKKEIRNFEKNIRNANLQDDFMPQIKKLKSDIKNFPSIDKAWLKSLIKNKNERRLFPDIYWDIMICYMKYCSINPSKMKDSDIVDIQHAVYIPYCDLWRGDKDFSNILQQGHISEKEKIVSRLSDLPQKIEQLKTIQNI